MKETIILGGMYDDFLLACQLLDSFRLIKLNESSVDAYYRLAACCFLCLACQLGGVMEHVSARMSFHKDLGSGNHIEMLVVVERA